jgi:hypothetical protein
MNNEAIVMAAILISGIAIGIVCADSYHDTYPYEELSVVGVDGDDILTGSDILPLARDTQIEFTIPSNTTEVHITFSH